MLPPTSSHLFHPPRSCSWRSCSVPLRAFYPSAKYALLRGPIATRRTLATPDDADLWTRTARSRLGLASAFAREWKRRFAACFYRPGRARAAIRAASVETVMCVRCGVPGGLFTPSLTVGALARRPIGSGIVVFLARPAPGTVRRDWSRSPPRRHHARSCFYSPAADGIDGPGPFFRERVVQNAAVRDDGLMSLTIKKTTRRAVLVISPERPFFSSSLYSPSPRNKNFRRNIKVFRQLRNHRHRQSTLSRQSLRRRAP